MQIRAVFTNHLESILYQITEEKVGWPCSTSVLVMASCNNTEQSSTIEWHPGSMGGLDDSQRTENLYPPRSNGCCFNENDAGVCRILPPACLAAQSPEWPAFSDASCDALSPFALFAKGGLQFGCVTSFQSESGIRSIRSWAITRVYNFRAGASIMGEFAKLKTRAL